MLKFLQICIWNCTTWWKI